MKFFSSIVLLAISASAWGDKTKAQCGPAAARLSDSERILASDVSFEGTEPIRQLKAIQELRSLLPETGRSPSVEQAIAYGETFFRYRTPKIEDGHIPQNAIATWRAGELFSEAREAGAELTPKQNEIAVAYSHSRRSFQEQTVTISTHGLEPEQAASLKRVLSLMGGDIVEGPDRLMAVAVPSDEDPTAAARVTYLMRDWNPTNGFDAALERLIDNGADLISSRATPGQLAEAPEVYSRWAAWEIVGHHASRGSGTVSYEDPYGRHSILTVPERLSQFGRAGQKQIAAEIEAIQIVGLINEKGEDLSGMAVKKLSKEEEHSNGRKCLVCHRVKGRQLFTLMPSSKLPTGFEFQLGELLPGVSEESRFVSGSAIRRSGMAKRIQEGAPLRLVED